MADVCLVPLVSKQINDAVPSKLLEAWAYGRPVLLAAGGESADIVRQCEGGLVIDPGDDDQLAEAVLAMQADPLQLAQYAQNGHDLVCRCYDRRVLAQQMARVLQDVRT
jgi:glycosyltransferase involved in cell wall biosynthesis